jgi:ComF family protein
MSSLVKTIFRDAYDALLPPICSVCGEPVEERSDALCNGCRDSFVPLGSMVCWQCGAVVYKPTKQRCKECPEDPVYFHSARGAFAFRGAIRNAVHVFKYNHRLELARPLARAMFMALKDHMQAAPFDEGPVDLLLPVPMHFLRRITRGYNHAEALAQEFAVLSQIPCVPHLLVRHRYTPRQALLPPEKRGKNIFAAFETPFPQELAGRRVGLFDDVMTSGHTVNECARVLRAAGAAEVRVFTLCRA